MKELREAIHAVLSADSELEALATGGIHHRIASDAVPPYVVFNKMAGVRWWAFSGPPIRNQVWLVKGVGAAEQAEEIDARCQAILTDAALSVDGYEVRLKPLPEDDISFGEDTDGEHFDHEGTNYRIMVEAETS